MLKPFDSAALLLHRAHSHLAEFRSWHTGYLSSGPGKHVCEQDPETGLFHYKYRVTRAPPEILAAITFDLINELRSALDHAVYDASDLLGGQPKRNTKFPFGWDDADSAASDLAGNATEVPVALHPKLLSYGAYHPDKGGDRTLFGLNEIRNQKIHRILSLYGVQRGETGINEMLGMGEVTILSHWESAKQEYTYLVTSAPGVGRFKADIALEIGLNEASTLGGKPALTALTEALYLVNRMVTEIAEETTRLKAAGVV